MATVANATVKVTMDRTGVDQGIATIGSQLKGMGREGAQAVGAVGRSLTMGLTLPLVAAGVGIVKVAADFERSMNRVAALSGATGAAFNKLNTQAKDLGATTQFSASQAADAMGFLAQAGFEAEQIYAAMPATLNLAGAAQLDLGRSADIVSNVLTGFRLPVEQLDRAVDVLTATFTSANTDLNQLGEAFKYVGPVASSAGLAFEDTAAALGLLSNSGIQASAAGTGLRQILITLSKEQEVFGVKTRDAAGNMRPLVDIMAEAEGKTIGLEDAINTFNIRGGPAFLALLGQGSDALRTLTDRLDDSAGSAERIQEVQMQGLVGEITKLKSAAEGLAIAFGESGLLAAMTGIVARVTESIRSFSQLDETTRRNILVAGGLLAALGPLLSIISKIALAIPNLVKAFQVLRLAMLPMFGPVGLVVAGTVALGTLAAVMGGRSRRALQDLRQATGTASDALASGDKGSLLSALDAVIDKVKGPTRDALVQLKEDLENTGTMDPGPVLEALDAIIDLAEGDTKTALETLRASMDDVEELDVSEVLSALDTVTAQVDGPVRAALLRWRQDLIQTGTVAVEQAQRAAAALVQVELFPDLARPGPIRAIEDLITHVDEAYRQVEADNIREALVAGGQGTRVQQSLLSGNFVDAIGFTNDAIARLQRTADATGNKMTADFADVLRGFAENLQRRSTEAFDAVFNDPGYFTPADSLVDVPDGGGTTPPAVAAAGRTVSTVLKDLDDSVAASLRIARFENTQEALLDSAQERAGLVNRAVAELLTDFPGEASGEVMEGLRGLREGFLAEARSIAADLARAEFVDPATRARLLAQARDQASRIALDTFFAATEGTVTDPGPALEAYEALRRVNPLLAAEFGGLVRVLRVMAVDIADAAINPSQLQAASQRNKDAATRVALDTVEAFAAALESATEGLDPEDGLEALKRLRDLSPELASNFTDLYLALLRLAGAASGATVSLPGAASQERDALRGQAKRVALDTVLAFYEALEAGIEINAAEAVQAMERFKFLAPDLRFDDLEGLEDLEVDLAAISRAFLILAASAGELAGAFDTSTLGQVPVDRVRESARAVALDTVLAFQEALIDGAEINVAEAIRALDQLKVIAPELDLRVVAPDPDFPEVVVDLAAFSRELMVMAAAAKAAKEGVESFIRPGMLPSTEESNDALVTAVDTVFALVNAGAAAEDVNVAMERLERVAPEVARALNSLFVKDIPLPTVGVGLTPDTSLTGIFGPPTDSTFRGVYDPETGQNLVDMSKKSAEEIEASAQQFRETVVRAGITLAEGLVNAIRNNDPGGALSSVAGFVGSLVGTVDPVAGMIIGFVGSLLGSLIPRPGEQQEREEQEAAAQASRYRSVPSINISANVTQMNNLGSPITDPSTQAALDQRIRNAITAAFEEIGLAEIRKAVFSGSAA